MPVTRRKIVNESPSKNNRRRRARKQRLTDIARRVYLRHFV
jgi:hypothetical protein